MVGVVVAEENGVDVRELRELDGGVRDPFRSDARAKVDVVAGVEEVGVGEDAEAGVGEDSGRCADEEEGSGGC